MSIHFEHELDELKQKLLTMASHAERAVMKAVQALQERDQALAQQVVDEDRVLDRFEIEIDDVSIRLLAKAPLASQLRFIAIAMKASHDLERVGDEACGIAKRARQLCGEPPFESGIDITRMAQLVLSMMNEAIESFVEHDPAKAHAVIPRDKAVDALNHQYYRDLAQCMVAHPDAISRCLCQMMVCKRLERIGDHATNIAEEVVYLFEGRDIRHAKSLAPA